MKLELLSPFATLKNNSYPVAMKGQLQEDLTGDDKLLIRFGSSYAAADDFNAVEAKWRKAYYTAIVKNLGEREITTVFEVYRKALKPFISNPRNASNSLAKFYLTELIYYQAILFGSIEDAQSAKVAWEQATPDIPPVDLPGEDVEEKLATLLAKVRSRPPVPSPIEQLKTLYTNTDEASEALGEDLRLAGAVVAGKLDAARIILLGQIKRDLRYM